jgi:hypothetical protein
MTGSSHYGWRASKRRPLVGYLSVTAGARVAG